MSWQRTSGLGALELAVLDRLWSDGPADVAVMHAAVGAPRGIASNTIQSTLERLFRKGLAERQKVGRAFEYRACTTRAEWLSRALGDLLEATPGASGDTVLAAFVDLADRAGEEQLAALEARIQQRRREREGRS
jgi:predicted transcriptional regulator